MKLNKKEIKDKILPFLEKSVFEFLNTHKNESFYSFAIGASGNDSCHIFLYLSTEEYFQELLEDEDEEFKNDEQDVYEYRYSVADWKYPEFSELEILNHDKLEEFYKSFNLEENAIDYNKCYEHILELYCECLIDFESTETYKKIPKTDDFKNICSEHDGFIKDFENRMNKVRERLSSNYR